MRIIEALGALMLPIAGIILFQIASAIPLISCCAWPVLLVLYLWMGYSAQKKGFELADSAVVGAVTGLGAGIIYAICSFIWNIVGAGIIAALGVSNAGGYSLANSMMSSIISMVCVILLFPVCGAIVAAIGYFVGGMIGKK